jgi:predicted nucleotidyltransferase
MDMALAHPETDAAFLDEVVRRLLSAGSPLKIVMFGSRARGDAHPHSDLDLLVVEEKSDAPRYKRATSYRLALVDLDIDKDIVVYTLDEIAEWANVPLAFITTVLREGKVLYEKPS